MTEFINKGFVFISLGNDLHNILTQTQAHIGNTEKAVQVRAAISDRSGDVVQRRDTNRLVARPDIYSKLPRRVRASNGSTAWVSSERPGLQVATRGDSGVRGLWRATLSRCATARLASTGRRPAKGHLVAPRGVWGVYRTQYSPRVRIRIRNFISAF